MTEDEQHQMELTYFRMNMLQAEIEMNAMISENQICFMKQLDPKYGYNDFMALIEKHGIHHNKFPFRAGG